jgi:hypothetical protein
MRLRHHGEAEQTPPIAWGRARQTYPRARVCGKKLALGMAP